MRNHFSAIGRSGSRRELLHARHERTSRIDHLRRTFLQFLLDLRPALGEFDPLLKQLNPILNWIGVHVHTLSDMFANLGVATAAKVKNPTGDGLGHYLRQFGPLGAESVSIWKERAPTNRGNSYFQPLSLAASTDDAGQGYNRFKITAQFDCQNSGEKPAPIA